MPMFPLAVVVIFQDGAHRFRLVIDFLDHVVREAIFSLPLLLFALTLTLPLLAPFARTTDYSSCWYGQSRTACISSMFTVLVARCCAPESVCTLAARDAKKIKHADTAAISNSGNPTCGSPNIILPCRTTPHKQHASQRPINSVGAKSRTGASSGTFSQCVASHKQQDARVGRTRPMFLRFGRVRKVARTQLAVVPVAVINAVLANTTESCR